uniref:DRBM domain-containing protein n=1 Tax=Phlebotomus papatasi TaxID=29031 RepID=A0A1B0GLV6_PHLPP
MPRKNPVYILEDICLRHKLPDPKYEDITNEFDEYYEYSVEAFGSVSTGKGESRKVAKQNAAENLLKLAKSDFLPEDMNSNKVQEGMIGMINYVGAVYEECMKSKLQLPVFDIITLPSKPNRVKFKCTCTVGNVKEEAEGYSKKEAKQAAAYAMMNRLSSKHQSAIKHLDHLGPGSTSEIFLNINPEQYDSAKRLLKNAPSTCNHRRCLEDVLQTLGLSYNFYQHAEDVGGKKVFELKYSAIYVQINEDSTSMYIEALNFLRELLQLN